MPMFQHKTLVHLVHCGNVGVDVQALGNRSMAEFGSLSADYDKNERQNYLTANGKRLLDPYSDSK